MAIKIKQDEEKPIATEIIAESIVKISSAIRQMRSGRLNNRALVILIQAAALGRISQADVSLVLNVMEDLEKTYLRPIK